VEVGAKSGGAWLRHFAPVTPGLAASRAALAVGLADVEMAPTRVAFAAGDVSAGHAAVIARTMTAIRTQPDPVDEQTRGEAQALLLATAVQVDPAQLGRAGAVLRNRLDPGAGDRLAGDEDAAEAQRSAYLVQDRTGMWQLTAHLPPVAGAMLAAAIDPLAAPRPAADGSPDVRPARQRLCDGLTGLAELALAGRPGTPGALPTRAGTPTRLVLMADLDTVLARADHPGVAPGELSTGEPGGWPISPLTVQTLACDAEVTPILTDPAGRPLDVGDTRYPFPPRIRRAIEVRDRHCTFHPCTAPPTWCHTHHLVPFSRGGPTSEANGTLLCGRHHRHVHARGWTGQLTDGHVVWRPPDRGQEPPGNAYTQEFDQLLKHLAQRWLTRNPQHRDTS
jgi:hypothetical protein